MPASQSSIFPLLLILLIPYIATARNPRASTDLVRSSCSRATYPSLCIRTLSNYPGPPAQNLVDLAQAAAKVSLTRAQKTSGYMAHLAQTGKRRRRREKVALSDCVEQLGDATSELGDTVRELKRLKTGSFKWRISNVKTWVSAALTCQSTCLDGINEMMMIRDDVRRKIRNLTKVTSNALYLINLLDD